MPGSRSVIMQGPLLHASYRSGCMRSKGVLPPAPCGKRQAHSTSECGAPARRVVRRALLSPPASSATIPHRFWAQAASRRCNRKLTMICQVLREPRPQAARMAAGRLRARARGSARSNGQRNTQLSRGASLPPTPRWAYLRYGEPRSDSWGCELRYEDLMDGREQEIVLDGSLMVVDAFATYRWGAPIDES